MMLRVCRLIGDFDIGIGLHKSEQLNHEKPYRDTLAIVMLPCSLDC